MVKKTELVDYFDSLSKDGTVRGDTTAQCLMELCERVKALEAALAALLKKE